MFSDMPNAWDERNDDTFGALEGAEGDDDEGLSDAFASIGVKRPNQEQVNQVGRRRITPPPTCTCAVPFVPVLSRRPPAQWAQFGDSDLAGNSSPHIPHRHPSRTPQPTQKRAHPQPLTELCPIATFEAELAAERARMGRKPKVDQSGGADVAPERQVHLSGGPAPVRNPKGSA